ncbi:CBS domain-containing protein [Streptomyces lycii]|uniref:CBS domain-containing protein n=1 Tax=Streptomyces lycii TaxID=2654337 RepID=A0ABQ7FBV7_9ACTN|nr:CBS domain-containing protein [Streptomyces lycii]KAF4405306.1 CBS domain-containing protein [Streptomyces lycii]
MHGTPHTVSDVMSTTVIAIGQEAPFREIVRIMQQWKVSALPVLAGEGRVTGVVSEADLLPKEEFRDSDPSRKEQMSRLADLAKAGAVTAGELMTSPAVCVDPGASLARAAQVMARKHVKRLPVTDAGGLLVGIVSRSDLLKVFLRPDEEIEEEVRRAVGGLFAGTEPAVGVQVREGVVTLAGGIHDRSLVPVAARLARAVEGVVDVECTFTSPAPGQHLA